MTDRGERIEKAREEIERGLGPRDQVCLKCGLANDPADPQASMVKLFEINEYPDDQDDPDPVWIHEICLHQHRRLVWEHGLPREQEILRHLKNRGLDPLHGL
jgi:hypothetical protein